MIVEKRKTKNIAGNEQVLSHQEYYLGYSQSLGKIQITQNQLKKDPPRNARRRINQDEHRIID